MFFFSTALLGGSPTHLMLTIERTVSVEKEASGDSYQNSHWGRFMPALDVKEFWTTRPHSRTAEQWRFWSGAAATRNAFSFFYWEYL
jgi:hypothetical protein